MILAELNGGTGNQMFQYAAAKSLSLHHDTEFRLVINPELDQYMPAELTKRPFDLHFFNIREKIAEPQTIESFQKTSLFSHFIEKLKPNFKRKIYREPFYHFDPHFFNCRSDVYLRGLWQSEKYFNPFRHVIRSIFTFDHISKEKFKHLSTTLQSEHPVSIHIRRGDYLADISLEVLGLMSVDYYSRAIEIIQSRIPNASFYFFSDDIRWAKENFAMSNAVFVSGEITQTHFEDLYLMSQCRHNIIANSSFSWWGAWLNNNPDKIVIAPKNWFNKGPKDTQDLIPEGWITI